MFLIFFPYIPRSKIIRAIKSLRSPYVANIQRRALLSASLTPNSVVHHFEAQLLLSRSVIITVITNAFKFLVFSYEAWVDLQKRFEYLYFGMRCRANAAYDL